MLTRPKDLHSGFSIWAARGSRGPGFKKLARDISSDVLVVGAGISGALIAELLAADGFEVTILDRRGGATGSTAASTSLVQYEIDVPITKLSDNIGEALAIRAWRRSYQALANLGARTDQLRIDCEKTSRPSLYLSGDLLNAEGIRREGEARRQAGFETDILARHDLTGEYGIDRPAALRSYGDFCADPVLLAKGYLKAAVAAGVRLFAPEEAIDLRVGSRGVTVTTKSGFSIRCQIVVFATGYEFPTFIPLAGHSLNSTFAFATRPQARRLWPEECLIWEASDPYLYMRTTADGRAIVGGEDEEFEDSGKRDAMLDQKVAMIGRKAKRLFPSLDVTPDFSWAGTFGGSEDGLPTIGEIPDYPNCWAVLGYGGNGITFSRLAAEIVRTSLCGGNDPDADIFKFR